MKKIKLIIKLIIRWIIDILSGQHFNFAQKRSLELNFKYFIETTQEVKKGENFESKVFNQSLAIRKLNEYVIFPNEILSFWHIVGTPNKGFQKSRMIKNGKLSIENGGGICQVSGILYHLSLLAGLEIQERYNHSVDIYTDETRFAPLGVDASVVYGYKDLRIKNVNSFPVKFELTIIDNSIVARLWSKELIIEKELFFELKETKDSKTILVKDKFKTLNISKYTI